MTDFDKPDDYDEDVPLGLEAVLAATDKILAVNRGVAEPDQRDSWQFKRIHTPDRLMRERVQLDADGLRRKFMRYALRRRNLSGAHAGVFTGYTEGQLISNPLASPLEEINPLQISDQHRRVTQMGPGGIGSRDAITDEMRAIHPSQFGFVSLLEGPESEAAGIDVRMAWGTRVGSDGRPYQRVRNRRTGKIEWVSPEDLDGKVLGIPA